MACFYMIHKRQSLKITAFMILLHECKQNTEIKCFIMIDYVCIQTCIMIYDAFIYSMCGDGLFLQQGVNLSQRTTVCRQQDCSRTMFIIFNRNSHLFFNGYSFPLSSFISSILAILFSLIFMCCFPCVHSQVSILYVHSFSS